MPLLTDLSRAAALLMQADALIIAAGAGMGVDSGLPDFRGNDGFWKAYPTFDQLGLPFVEVSTPRTFERDPALAWGFYGHRLQMYRDAEPHAGFKALQRIVSRVDRGAFVFTSNVDGHFQRAGFNERHVVECHGSLLHLQCLKPCGPEIWSSEALQPSVDDASCQWLGDLPRCSYCGRLARPNVLLFNDSTWIADRTELQASRLSSWLYGCRRPVVLELGAGTAVATVRALSEAVVSRHAGHLIRINPRECEVAQCEDVGLPLGAREALSHLERLLG